MAQYDLCTLADVKAWLGRSDENSDALLAALITRTSRQILSYLRRPTILPHTISEIRNGTGGYTLVLREWPALSISSLTISGRSIAPLGSNMGGGYALEPWTGVPPGSAQVLAVNGLCFPRETLNVAIAYRAGFQVSAEAQTVANDSVTVFAPYGAWACDGGLAYANGTPLTLVSGPPGAGQYQLDADTPGSYIFNAADNGASVLIT